MLDPKPSPQEIYNKREEFGLENSVEMLTDIIETEKDNNKRKEAVKYLGGIGNYVPQLKNDCFTTIENILISEDKVDLKCEAAKALGKLGNNKALKPLNWILEQKIDSVDLRIAALKAIRKIRRYEFTGTYSGCTEPQRTGPGANRSFRSPLIRHLGHRLPQTARVTGISAKTGQSV